jgi:nucleotide-binding universal stress UspA family protein
MNSASRRPRIAWLVNLYSDPDQQHAQGASLLRTLAAQLDADVVPFYCIDTDATALEDIDPVEHVAYTKARLAALLGEHDLPTAESVVLSAGTSPSTDDKADALAAAIRSEDVLFTFVHSHTYSAVDRFLLGSFSEAFFTRARRPVLVLSPHAGLPETYDSIVFGSDLGEQCTRAWNTLLPIARLLRASVHIEHQLVVRELSPFMKSDATRAQYEEEIDAMREQANASIQRLVLAAQAVGVPTTTSVEAEGPSITPAEGIEGRANKRGTAIIAVPAHGDKKRPGNIGSTALWLIRHAQRPVLVIPAHE